MKEQLLTLRIFILSFKPGLSSYFKGITTCWTIVRTDSISYANESLHRQPGHLPATAETQAKAKGVQKLV